VDMVVCCVLFKYNPLTLADPSFRDVLPSVSMCVTE